MIKTAFRMLGRLLGRLRRPQRQDAHVPREPSTPRGPDVPDIRVRTARAPETGPAVGEDKEVSTPPLRSIGPQEAPEPDTVSTPLPEPPAPSPHAHGVVESPLNATMLPPEPVRFAADLGTEHSVGGSAGTERTLVVGLDFGTSTTKVVIHDLTFERYEAMSWSSAPDFGSVLLPSAVAIKNDALLFGNEAVACSNPTKLFGWFKICTLCPSDPAICRRCGGASPPGEFDVADLGSIPGAAVSAAFLAFVMGSVQRHLRRSYPNDQLELIWNVGCPIDRLDKLKAKQIYDSVVRVALTESETVVNGSPVLLLAHLRDQLSAPPEVDGNLFIRPETHAAVMAFLRSPHADEMPYAIVDVGAGTTDISVFLYARSPVLEGNPHIANYLADGTFAIGGDDVDFEMQQLRGCDLNTARQLKLTGQWSGLRTVQFIVDRYQRTICRVVADKMLTASALAEYSVFLIGGGSRLTSLPGALAKAPHTTIPRNAEFPIHRMSRANDGTLRHRRQFRYACRSLRALQRNPGLELSHAS